MKLFCVKNYEDGVGVNKELIMFDNLYCQKLC